MTAAAGAIIEIDDVFTGVDVQVFTVDGTWTKPAGAQRVFVRVQGAGGGGGGAATTIAGQGSHGGNGGAGGYCEKWYNASDLGSTEAVVVGTGGAGGAAGANNGTVGESSTFDSLTANGGGAGAGSAATAGSGNPTGGSGGTATGGDVNIPGGDGANGQIVASVVARNGLAGKAQMSGQARVTVVGAGPGTAGPLYGGGGGGAACTASQTQQAGGTGGNGIVVVTSYI